MFYPPLDHLINNDNDNDNDNNDDDGCNNSSIC